MEINLFLTHLTVREKDCEDSRINSPLCYKSYLELFEKNISVGEFLFLILQRLTMY